MEDELWMRKIKDRLNDYSAPVTPDGWKRLEQELNTRKAPVIPRKVPFIRRWSVAAAAAILLFVSVGSLWFLQSPVANEVRQQSDAVVADASEPMVTPDDKHEESVGSHPKKLNRQSHHTTKLRSLVAVQTPQILNIVPEEEKEATTVIDKNADVMQTENTVAEQPSNEEKRETSETPMMRRRPSSKDKLHIPAATRKSEKSGNWAMGLAVGNMGGLGNGLGKTNPISAASTNINRLDWVGTTAGVITVPKGQELIFKNGMPYLQSSRRNIESVDHKQPISFGLSVRKNLQHGLSVESGLTYTFLSSDIKFEGSSKEVRQKLHYIGIPLRVNWDFLNKGAITLYVSGGGAIEKCIYGTIGDEKHTVKPLQFSVMSAVGVQYNVGNRVGLYVEPGVSYYFDDNSSVETIRKENPCNFTLQGGIRLTY